MRVIMERSWINNRVLLLRCREFKQIFAIQNEWSHFIYTLIYSGNFHWPCFLCQGLLQSQITGTRSFVPCRMNHRPGAESWGAGLLLVSYTESARGMLMRLLQFPSSLLWFSVPQEVRMAHAFGVPTTMSVLVSQKSKLLSLIRPVGWNESLRFEDGS